MLSLDNPVFYTVDVLTLNKDANRLVGVVQFALQTLYSIITLIHTYSSLHFLYYKNCCQHTLTKPTFGKTHSL